MLSSDEFFSLVLDRRVDPPGPISTWRSWWEQEAAARPELARSGFVLTSAEAIDLGLTRARIRTAVRRGRWQRAGRGVVSPVDVTRDLPASGASFVRERRVHALRAAAAARVRLDDAIACRSAAVLHGFPTLYIPSTTELLARDVGGGIRRAHHVYKAALDAVEITDWFGCAVTSPSRTLVDLGRHDRFDAIMAVDAALRERVVTEAQIVKALEVATGWPYVRQARRVLALGDPRAESPLESITRLRIAEDGLPMPELQVSIGPWRVDFFWAEWGLVLEADGRVKYTAEQRWDEKKREIALRRLGVRRIERVIMEDVLSGWPATSDLLHSILR